MPYEIQRRNMIAGQMKPNHVVDPRLIEALAQVPREAFVPSRLRAVAYVDEDLAIGRGRYLLEPMVFGRLVQAAEVGPGDRVLDIGCGTGYGAAILARLAGRVVALESDRTLAAEARTHVARFGLTNVEIVSGPLAEGQAEFGPYQAIIVEGSIPKVPERLLDQLAEHGRLVAVVGRAKIGKAVRLWREGGVVGSAELFDAAVPPLPGFVEPQRFVF